MKKSAKIAIGVGAGAVVLLGGAYVASYFVAGNQLPAQASVEGVAIGGLTPGEAADVLRAEFGPALEEPIALTAATMSAPLVPAESASASMTGASLPSTSAKVVTPAMVAGARSMVAVL